MADHDETVKGGPANHAAHTDLDAPTPPGGPLRQDRPDADVNPTGAVDPEPRRADPDVQQENAGTSLDQPSDGSGAE